MVLWITVSKTNSPKNALIFCWICLLKMVPNVDGFEQSLEAFQCKIVDLHGHDYVCAGDKRV